MNLTNARRILKAERDRQDAAWGKLLAKLDAAMTSTDDLAKRALLEQCADLEYELTGDADTIGAILENV